MGLLCSGRRQKYRGEDLREIADVIMLIEEHPFAGRARDELRPGLRPFAAAPHVAFYRVVDDTPQVVRMLDGRQNIEEKFAVRGPE